jgi:hypothetical protein
VISVLWKEKENGMLNFHSKLFIDCLTFPLRSVIQVWIYSTSNNTISCALASRSQSSGEGKFLSTLASFPFASLLVVSSAIYISVKFDQSFVGLLYIPSFPLNFSHPAHSFFFVPSHCQSSLPIRIESLNDIC